MQYIMKHIPLLLMFYHILNITMMAPVANSSTQKFVNDGDVISMLKMQ